MREQLERALADRDARIECLRLRTAVFERSWRSSPRPLLARCGPPDPEGVGHRDRQVRGAGAAAEVARRSRVMAGLDEDGEGQALEAGIVSALRALIGVAALTRVEEAPKATNGCTTLLSS